jgi:hypothetical protein
VKVATRGFTIDRFGNSAPFGRIAVAPVEHHAPFANTIGCAAQ